MLAMKTSFSQQRLWFLSQMESVSAAYHISLGLRLRGELDVEALRKALDYLVARHEPLRTTFSMMDGEPMQYIAEVGQGFALGEYDLRDRVDAVGELERLRVHEATAPFDLKAGPLIRGRLIRLANAEYVLLITMHHIISDGWSMGVLLSELSTLYRDYHTAGSASLGDLDIQYADYAAWQREHFSGPLLDKSRAYWKQKLAGIPALHQLPTDRPRPEQQDYTGCAVGIDLDEELSGNVRALSRARRTTLFQTVLAAWAVVLGRLSNQDDIVVGVPVANRKRLELEGLIGFFLNTLVVRVDVSGTLTVGELLDQVKTTTLAAHEHDDLPFEQVVEAIAPRRSVAHTPLFQVMFVWQNNDSAKVSFAGVEAVPLGSPVVQAKFDLSIAMAENGKRITGSLQYAASLFDRSTIEHYAGYLRNVLAAMVADEDCTIAALKLVSEAERRELIAEHSATKTLHSNDRHIHESFEARAAETPGAVALTYEGAQVTYAELNARANKVARYLRSLGVKPDDRVALCVERSVEMIVGILAVLKAGAGYVPLDPSYPPDRLRFMLADSAPVAVLTNGAVSEAVRESLDFSGVRVVDLQADAARWAGQSGENVACDGLTPQHLAYVIYTSGTSGQPKGVMVEHANVVRLFGATEAWFRFSASDVWTLFHSAAFDFSVWEMWGALLYGGRLVIVPHAVTRSPEEFYKVVCTEGVTVLNQTPSAFRQLLAAQRESGATHCLRTMIFGGEALDPATLAPWYADARNAGVALVNMYGITETTVHVTYQPIEAEHLAQPGRSPIGQRIPDLSVYILDVDREPVPTGVVGELYVGGAGVARGYLNRPDLTAERFIASPFVAGERLYKTGDLARYLSDGTIEYLGRNDSQVKIRGFRIELGEIEARLMQFPTIEHAIVLAREDSPGERRLVAYYVAAGRELVQVESLRTHLQGVLPEYMIPAAYVRLDALPLTANGKLDRKLLPAPESSAYVDRMYEAPDGDVEQRIARIWSEVLGVELERIGRHDNFFELGGHSLLAMRVLSHTRNAGLGADVQSLFAAPSLRELANIWRVEEETIDIPPCEIPNGSNNITPSMLPLVDLSEDEISRVVATVQGGAPNVQDIYPLAPMQEGVLFHSLLSNEGDPYIQRVLHRFDSRSRLDAFIAAFQATIDRHDILRTAVVWEGIREPVQVVWRQARLSVEEITYDGSSRDVTTEITARLDPRFYRMDLHQAPLFHAAVAQESASERWIMVLLFHHLVDDHVSMKALYGEIRAHLQGKDLPRPIPFRDFVVRARAKGHEQEHRAFFSEMLRDIQESTAPFGITDIQGNGSAVLESRDLLDPGLAIRLRQRARTVGVSTASLCHLAWARVLAVISATDDVVFGTVLFGRASGVDVEAEAFGPHINTLPIRVRLGQVTVEEGLRRTHHTLANLMRYQHASLALAQRCSSIAAPAPLFTSILNYRRALDGVGRSAVVEGFEVLGGTERTNYPLALSIDDFGEALRLTVQSVTAIDPARVCCFMKIALDKLVDALERAPETPLHRIEVISETERYRLLVELNATESAVADDRLIHEIFEVQAAATPDAIAIVHEDNKLTYGELNARANRLARHLRSVGVLPDMHVALCFERSAEMIVALLAVLKAGGAYVPLDPSYSPGRLRFIVSDSRPAVILTHQAVSGAPRELLEQSSTPTIDLQRDAVSWVNESSWDLEREALTSRHLAYVIYTSGSTGAPKGVMVEHRGLPNLARAAARGNSVDSTSRVLQFASLSFDASVWEIFTALCAGAVLIVPAHGIFLTGAELTEAIDRGAVTHATLPPAVLDTIHADTGCGSLQVLVTAGEAVRATQVNQWGVGRQLINAYGPTEATVCASMYHCDDIVSNDPPIGRPIANVRLYVLDRYNEPVPFGVIGELHIGGVGVARGYLHQPELTTERFTDSPFVRGDRLYKTGDLARYRRDGTVEFVGRNDFQVKIRGMRVELGEIEVQLAQHPMIRDALVVARESAPGEKRLVAYYSTVDRCEIAVESLRARLQESLPTFMIPAAYVHMEAFPLSSTGKVDRRALPAPGALAYATHDYEAPTDHVEETLSRIWGDVLDIDMARISRQDNFFDLGGHSLLAVRVLSAIRRELETDLSLAQVFANPVLRDMAMAVLAGAPVGQQIIPKMERSGSLPLALAQQRIWLSSQLGGFGQAYHIPIGVRLRGKLDRDALRAALDELVARHETLRTTFSEADGNPVQVISASAAFTLKEHDLRFRDDAMTLLEGLLGDELAAPFYLEDGPLIRGCLVLLGDDDHALLITAHHIVFDGWSRGIFTKELTDLYRAHHSNASVSLPDLEIQYADYAAWQRLRLSGSALQAQIDFWKHTLEGVPYLHQIATDRPRPSQQDYAGGYIRFAIDDELTKALRAKAHSRRSSLFQTVLSAWSILLSRLSNRDEVVIGTPVTDRRWAETERLIGFFVNTLPLRIDLSGEPTVNELLDRVKATFLAARENQDVPLEQILEVVSPPRSLSHTPLFQLAFVWQNGAAEPWAFPELRATPLGVAADVAEFDLTLYLTESGGRVSGVLEYASALFDKSTAERYVGYFRNLLAAMVSDHECSIGQLTMLSSDERQRMLSKWIAESAPQLECCAHELFEAQVSRNRGAVAVSYNGAQLTYGELDARANQLARYLQSVGVKPDVRVALCVGRSMETVVALLAILKAGGAYAPLDPTDPPERLKSILRDCEPAAVLTDRQNYQVICSMVHASDTAVIDLQMDAWRWANESAQNPDRSTVTPRHIVHVIYASGSTGVPKGVMIEHRSLYNSLHFVRDALQVNSRDRVLSITPIGLDTAALEIFLPLIAGAQIVLLSESDADDEEVLAREIVDRNITVMQASPSRWKALIESGWRGKNDLVAISGNDVLTSSLAAQIRSRVARLWHGYGPSEATVYSSLDNISERDAVLTERLRLAPVQGHNAMQLWILMQQPDLRAYQELLDVDAETFCDVISNRVVTLYAGVQGNFEWLVYEGEAREPVGWVSLRIVPDASRVGEIGYSVLREGRGRGIATEAVRAVVREAFARTNLARVRAHCVAENIASQQVVRNAGFYAEDIRRSVSVNGQIVDVRTFVCNRGRFAGGVDFNHLSLSSDAAEVLPSGAMLT